MTESLRHCQPYLEADLVSHHLEKGFVVKLRAGLFLAVLASKAVHSHYVVKRAIGWIVLLARVPAINSFLDFRVGFQQGCNVSSHESG